MNKRHIALIFAFLLPLCVFAQEEEKPARKNAKVQYELPDAFLDTLVIEKQTKVNDYSMIGFSTGVTFSRQYLNPSYIQNWMTHPNPSYYSVMFTHYQKMFGYLPYFGFTVGASYSREGYNFIDKLTGDPTHLIHGATTATIETVEIPFLMEAHVDADWFRFLADLGMYGGYRLSIHRSGGNLAYEAPELENAFADTDHRFDYGAIGGVGFGLAFAPVEIHLKGLVRFSFSTLYDPDYRSTEYYYYSNPLDFMITLGVHFHLSNRFGKTRKELKGEAWKMVYGDENSTGTDR